MSAPNKTNKIRLKFAFAIVVLCFIGLISRLFYIQVLNNEFYKKMAINQQTRDIELPAQRGVIYDRNMMKLAFSVKTFTIYARPSEISASYEGDMRKLKIEETSNKIAELLEIEPEKVIERLTSEKSIVKIDKWVTKDKADLISRF